MVNNADTKVTYRGNGSTTVFPFSFPFISKDYIRVSIFDETTSLETVLTKDYFIDTVAKTVTYPGYAAGQEPAESDRPPVLSRKQTITIYRQTDVNQLSDLGDKYPLPTIEDMSDKLTEIVQEIKEELSRAIKVRIGSGESADDFYKVIDDYAKARAKAAFAGVDISAQVNQKINTIIANAKVNTASANKLAVARTINVTDASGTHTGTGAKFDGSANVTIKLPASIKATLEGKATSAGTADVAKSVKSVAWANVSDKPTLIKVSSWDAENAVLTLAQI